MRTVLSVIRHIRESATMHFTRGKKNLACVTRYRLSVRELSIDGRMEQSQKKKKKRKKKRTEEKASLLLAAFLNWCSGTGIFFVDKYCIKRKGKYHKSRCLFI